MLTSEAPITPVSPDSDEWVPAWWGSDEANAKEATAFTNWTRSMRPE